MQSRIGVLLAEDNIASGGENGLELAAECRTSAILPDSTVSPTWRLFIEPALLVSRAAARI
jgi:hypothetical protein